MTAPTKAQADAAYAHREDNPDAYTAREPSAEVLANVEIIRAFESDPANQPEENNGVAL